MQLEIICLEDAAFTALIDKVIEQIQQRIPIKKDKWISGKEAMQMLRIKSTTTLQKLRDEGNIRYTQPEKKIVLYDRDSMRTGRLYQRHILVMEEELDSSPEYIKFFNAGYQMQKHEPQLLDKILKGTDRKNGSLKAIEAGRQQAEREKIIEYQQQIKARRQEKKRNR